MPALSKALDFLLPPLCLSCDAAVTGHGTLCPTCWSQIQFVTAPYCQTCGMPFETPVGEGETCGACFAYPPAYTAARAAMLYTDASKRLILGFKHGDRTHSAKTFAQWMQRAGQEFCANADLIIPVPLHRWRLFNRRYNQAALLAQELAKRTGKSALADGLLRIRATAPQGHQNRKQRQTNIKGAFAINPRHRSLVKDKSILLIDDVLTTGATVDECCRTLSEAKSIQVLTLARVRAYL